MYYNIGCQLFTHYARGGVIILLKYGYFFMNRALHNKYQLPKRIYIIGTS